jgi:hypothetical protein
LWLSVLPVSGSHTHPLDTFYEEFSIFSDQGLLSGVQECQPGRCFDCNPKSDYLFSGNCNLTDMVSFENRKFESFAQYIQQVVNSSLAHPRLAQFVPNFKEAPISSYSMSHGMLSQKDSSGNFLKDIQVQVYRGTLSGKKVEWHMARDREGRAWIDRIRLSDSEVTTFGTDAEIVDSGILTNKALEYAEQSWGLAEGAERKDTALEQYVDITPLLKELSPIQQWLGSEGGGGARQE